MVDADGRALSKLSVAVGWPVSKSSVRACWLPMSFDDAVADVDDGDDAEEDDVVEVEVDVEDDDV